MERRVMGNYHARCGAGEKPEVETPEAYLSLFGAAKISDNDKWIVINSDSNELTFVPKDKNDTELVICKNVCLKKDGEDTHVLLIFQKSGELLSKARKYIKSNNDRFYNLALDLRPGVKEQINQESDVEVQQLIDKILQVESEEELSLYD